MASETGSEVGHYTLRPKQHEFIFNKAKYIGFYGGIRNGKTLAACLKGLTLSEVFPGNVGLIGRRTYAQLFDTTANELFQIIKAKNGGTLNPGPYLERWHASGTGPDAQTIILRNGSRIRLRYAEDEQNFLGQELGWFYVDQAEDIPENIYEHLESRLSFWNETRREEFKAKMGYYPRAYGFITGNPAPSWVKTRYKENPSGQYVLIEATSDENELNLPPGYVQELRAMKPLAWVKRFMDGDWGVSSGMIYPEFNEAVHVIDYFDIPAHWPRFICLDHGYRNPTAVLWLAVDEYGNIYAYKEHYQAEWIVSQHAAAIKALCVGEPIKRSENGGIVAYFDPSTAGKSGIQGRSVLEEYRIHGIYGIPANNHVQAGILKVAEAIHVNPSHHHPRIPDLVGAPHFYIIRDRCPNLVTELKEYQWHEVPPGGDGGVEKPQKVKDHAADALRYGMMAILENKSDPFREKIDTQQQFLKQAKAFQSANAFVPEEENT
jgi:hypothetical protein